MRGDDVPFITPDELAELRALRDNVDAGRQRLEAAQQFLADEESLLRAAVIRIARRYGFSPQHAIDLDTGAVKKMAPPSPNAGGSARSAPAGEAGRRARAADPARNGRRGLRPERGSRIAALEDGPDDAGHADTRDAGA
jgi:hypothetical protein